MNTVGCFMGNSLFHWKIKVLSDSLAWSVFLNIGSLLDNLYLSCVISFFFFVFVFHYAVGDC